MLREAYRLNPFETKGFLWLDGYNETIASLTKMYMSGGPAVDQTQIPGKASEQALAQMNAPEVGAIAAVHVESEIKNLEKAESKDFPWNVFNMGQSNENPAPVQTATTPTVSNVQLNCALGFFQRKILRDINRDILPSAYPESLDWRNYNGKNCK